MTEWFSAPQKIVSARLGRLAQASLAVAIALMWVNPSLAADPFRTNDQRKIGDKTEAAFKAIFQQGNYKEAELYLQQAESSEPNEPLAYAMKASLAYANKDWSTLDTYSKKTLSTGQNLIAVDPLRGNLYAAVGHFLSGAVILQREGTLNGAPQALI
jgi:Tfp pilus assembly protein PilF